MPGVGEMRGVEATNAPGPSAEHIEDQDTARLVARIQAGETRAFDLLYQRYFDRVYAYLCLLMRDAHEAEDATQQVFIKVLEALPRYRPDPGKPFRAWLFVIARRHALNQIEKLHRLELEETEQVDRRRERSAAGPLPPTGLDWLTDANILLLIERLPVAQRQVLILRYMLDLTDSQIATILGRNPGDVRILQHRALAFLRKRLLALGQAPKPDKQSRMRRIPRQDLVARSRRWALTDY